MLRLGYPTAPLVDLVDGSSPTALKLTKLRVSLWSRESLLMANNGPPDHVACTSALPLTADIVGGFRVERRIEIYRVNALGRDAVAENL